MQGGNGFTDWMREGDWEWLGKRQGGLLTNAHRTGVVA